MGPTPFFTFKKHVICVLYGPQGLRFCRGNFNGDLFPVELVKKNGFCANSFFVKKNGGLTILTWSCRAAPDCFRLFPTVSSSLEGQRRPWTIDSTKIATVNTLLHDPCAGRLLEMMHFDFKTQYTLRIPKFQDLVKFNRMILYTYIYMCVYIYILDSEI